MSGILKKLRGKFMAGLVTLVPIVATIYILKLAFNFFAGFTTPLLNRFIKVDIPSLRIIIPVLGFIITIVLVFFLGVLVTNILGKRLVHLGELILKRIPIASAIYSTVKQITNALAGTASRAFQKAVLFEYPRKELWTIAFVTGESTDEAGSEYYHLFVPTTPNPTSGFMIILQKDQTKNTDLTVEEALKIIISGGMLAPKVNQVPTV